MVVLKLTKTFPMNFTSNQDYQRAFRRTLVRAGIEVAYSEGFSPHMQVDFTPPIPLGIESLAEYVSVNTKLPADEVMVKFNQNAPQGMRVLGAFNVDKFNPAASTFAARYCVAVQPEIAEKILAFAKSDVVEIRYVDRGKEVVREVGKKIFDINYNDGKIDMLLAAGNDNLRADRLMQSAGVAAGADIRAIDLVKTETCLSGGVSFEKFLDGRV